jgi:hypothetical protein
MFAPSLPPPQVLFRKAGLLLGTFVFLVHGALAILRHSTQPVWDEGRYLECALSLLGTPVETFDDADFVNGPGYPLVLVPSSRLCLISGKRWKRNNRPSRPGPYWALVFSMRSSWLAPRCLSGSLYGTTQAPGGRWRQRLGGAAPSHALAQFCADDRATHDVLSHRLYLGLLPCAAQPHPATEVAADGGVFPGLVTLTRRFLWARDRGDGRPQRSGVPAV